MVIDVVVVGDAGVVLDELVKVGMLRAFIPDGVNHVAGHEASRLSDIKTRPLSLSLAINVSQPEPTHEISVSSPAGLRR